MTPPTPLERHLRTCFEREPVWGELGEADEPRPYGLPAAIVDIYAPLVGEWPLPGGLVKLSAEYAFAIWHLRYVTEPRLDEVAAISPDIAVALLDVGIALDLPAAFQALRLCLNALSNGDWPRLEEQGGVDAALLAVLRRAVKTRGHGVGAFIEPILRVQPLFPGLADCLRDAKPGDVATIWAGCLARGGI